MNIQRGIVSAYDRASTVPQYGSGAMMRRRRTRRSAQSGAGFMDWVRKGVAGVKKGMQWAKDNQVVSKIGNVANAVGATDYLNNKTGGKFSQAVAFGQQKGYGRRRKRTVRRRRY